MEEAKNIKQGSKTFEELKELTQTVKKFKLTDLLIPLVSVIALVILTIFVYVPMISNALDSINEANEVKGKIETMKKLDESLSGMDLATMQTDLANSRKVIPFSLQVSDFLSYVDDSAQNKGLDFKEIVTGDITIKESTSKNTDSVIKGVSGPLKYVGNINQITDFLDKLQVSSPYIISADQIQLKKLPGSNNWEISLTVTGYYIDRNALNTPNIYSNFIPYTNSPEIVKLFNDKSAMSD